MDAFYASVELLRYPQLKGLPVVIGGGRRREDDALTVAYGGRLADIPVDAFPLLRDYVGRGVITTATYQARAFGVGSAMGRSYRRLRRLLCTGVAVTFSAAGASGDSALVRAGPAASAVLVVGVPAWCCSTKSRSVG